MRSSKWIHTDAGLKRRVQGEWVCRSCGMSYPNSEQSFIRNQQKMCELCAEEHRKGNAMSESPTADQFAEWLKQQVVIEDGNTEWNEVYLEVKFLGTEVAAAGGTRKSIIPWANTQAKTMCRKIDAALAQFKEERP